MEIGFPRTEGGGGEESLPRGVQDEGGVEAASRPDIERFGKAREGEGGAHFPATCSVHPPGDNPGERSIIRGDPLQGSREQAGPPSPVRGQIELEVGVVVGMGEEELGDIILPELRRKLAGPGGGMNEGGGRPDGPEVEVPGIKPEAKPKRRSRFLAIPVK